VLRELLGQLVLVQGQQVQLEQLLMWRLEQEQKSMLEPEPHQSVLELR